MHFGGLPKGEEDLMWILGFERWMLKRGDVYARGIHALEKDLDKGFYCYFQECGKS